MLPKSSEEVDTAVELLDEKTNRNKPGRLCVKTRLCPCRI